MPAVAERTGATPFDIEGVFRSRRGGTRSLGTEPEAFGTETPPLRRLAAIVRGADTARPDLADPGPAATGPRRHRDRRPRGPRDARRQRRPPPPPA